MLLIFGDKYAIFELCIHNGYYMKDINTYNHLYKSRCPDANDNVNYSDEENAIWSFLYNKQLNLIRNKADNIYLEGLDRMSLNTEHIPQISEINNILKKHTHWQVRPVLGTVSEKDFFQLLSNAYFPVATFIRRREDIDFCPKPDIFHEVFGHLPFLTNRVYSLFIQNFAKVALTFSEKKLHLFFSLFWFTIECGLINTTDGLRIYGASILSSKRETLNSLLSDQCLRLDFDPLSALQMSYKIQMIQPLYYVIKDLSELYKLLSLDYSTLFAQLRE